MKTKTLIALMLPIAVLLGITIYNEYLSRTHTEYIFPIEAYDPRDYLAGNYLRFKIKYPLEVNCEGEYEASQYQLNICLKPTQEVIKGSDLSGCEEWIEGRCSYKHFDDKLHRFYIPQKEATRLERALFEGQGEIILSVGKGNAIIKDLKINGRSWKDY